MEHTTVPIAISETAIRHITENTQRIEKCLLLLTSAEVWKRPNPAANSIGNLILHLCGNVTQYIISSMGGAPDKRNRDQEFFAHFKLNNDQLLEELYTTVAKAKAVIKATSEEELLRKRIVQGFSLNGVEIIIHVTEHFSYHTGQIALITKLIKNVDLGFYAGLDLNQKNQ